MSAAAVFLENFDNDLRATETQKLGFDKEIFFWNAWTIAVPSRMSVVL